MVLPAAKLSSYLKTYSDTFERESREEINLKRCGSFVVALLAMSVGQVNADLVLTFGNSTAGEELYDSSANTTLSGATFTTTGILGSGTDTYATGDTAPNTGVSFDLTVTSSGPSLNFTNQAIRPAGNIESGNGNTLTFAISNVSGLLAGQSLNFTGLTTWFGTADDGTNGEGYAINGMGVEVPVAATGNGYDVPDFTNFGVANSMTISAVQFGAMPSSFQIRSVQVGLTAVPEPTSFVMFGVCGMGLFIRRRK